MLKNGIVAGLLVAGGVSGQSFTGFEDLAPGTMYFSGDNFVTEGIAVSVSDLVTTSFTTSGAATVVGPASDLTGFPGTPSNEMLINNVTLTFSFGGTASVFGFDFGEFGGVNTFEVNGDVVEFTDMATFFASGPTIGGVTFSAVTAGPRGQVTAVGSASSFSIGGQELAIDNLRIIPTPGTGVLMAAGGLVALRRRR